MEHRLQAFWQIFWEPIEYEDLVRYYKQQIESNEEWKKNSKRRITNWNHRWFLELMLEYADDNIKLWSRKLKKLEWLPLHGPAWYVLHPNESPPRRKIKPGSITDEDIQKAKAVPIEDLYEGTLRHVGGKLSGKCPFHDERTPSFKIYLDQNKWHCYGACSKGGDVIDYIRARDNVEFLEAVKKLL